MNKKSTMYDCWLKYDSNSTVLNDNEYLPFLQKVLLSADSPIIQSAVNEIRIAAGRIAAAAVDVITDPSNTDKHIHLSIAKDLAARDAYRISKTDTAISILGSTETGILYGVFHLLLGMAAGKPLADIQVEEAPAYALRSINHWDNMQGDIERGYAGNSIFFKDNTLTEDYTRITDYARMLASIGINAVTINNVNVHQVETLLITKRFLDGVARYAEIFQAYGIALYLSVNYAAPMEIGGLTTADPLDTEVQNWWKQTAAHIYAKIPQFGGFVVKADSENRPGPFTYGRNHADGANMLACALKPYNGTVIWRCFVYDCHLDWRDRSKDRARAAYDHFKPLDGAFADNVILQIKNGPMDFQIREATSPLLGAMPKTNQAVEFQIAQEYTGHQIDLCYLVPMWKECLDFDTYRDGKGSPVKQLVCATAAVSNIGDSKCWTGNPLAGANLFGYGRLVFNPERTAEEIAREWVSLTFGNKEDNQVLTDMLLCSRAVYEQYTSPLGIGWMVKEHKHYGPGIDDYEYSPWGTYHYADTWGLGVDRTVKTGTGFTAQYAKENADMYEHIDSCPEELLLFFHHVPYTHQLRTGKTVIQHIYDTHFHGVEEVERFCREWEEWQGHTDAETFAAVQDRFQRQLRNSREWRDVVNTYFYRKTGIDDALDRKIYK